MQSDDEAYLIALFQLRGSYHDHKEASAFLVFGLQAVFFLGLFSLDVLPSALSAYPEWWSFLGVVFIWFCFHLMLRFQLANRRLAAISVAAASAALEQKQCIVASADDTASISVGFPLRAIDSLIFPIRSAVWSGDTKGREFAEGALIEGRTLEAFQYHHALAKREAAKSFWKFGLPAEAIVTLGSVILLVFGCVAMIALTEQNTTQPVDAAAAVIAM